jgi:hypothetical protein
MLTLARELWAFMRVRKRYWMLPILVMTALFGALVAFSQGTVVSPFLYTLF